MYHKPGTANTSHETSSNELCEKINFIYKFLSSMKGPIGPMTIVMLIPYHEIKYLIRW